MHIQQGNLKSFGLQLLQCMQHRVVFKGGGDNMVLSFPFPGQGRGTDRLVVRFASAGGEIDFPRLRVDHRGNFLPRVFQGFFGLLPDPVQARRVSVFLPHALRHGGDGRLAHGAAWSA